MRLLLLFFVIGAGPFFWNCSRVRVADDTHVGDQGNILDSFDINDELAKSFEVEPEKEEEDRPSLAATFAVGEKATVATHSKGRKKTAVSNVVTQKNSKAQLSVDKGGYITSPSLFNPKADVDYPELYKKYDVESKPLWDKLDPKIYVGEVFTFAIKYFGINCASIFVKTLPVTMLGDRKAFHFHANLKSAKFYEYFYTVDDYVDSFVDATDFFPLRYSLIQRESKQDVDDLQLYDKGKLKNYYWYKRKKGDHTSSENKEVFIPRYLLDSFSPLFFFRGVPLKVGDKFNLPIITRSEVWQLTMNIVAREQLTIQNQVVWALKIQAETHFPGVLKKRGDIFFWYSDDVLRRPLKFEAKVKIGKIEGELINYSEGMLYTPPTKAAPSRH